jgi:hypothetical protein
MEIPCWIAPDPEMDPVPPDLADVLNPPLEAGSPSLSAGVEKPT